MQERVEREVQIVLDEKSIKVLKELSKIHINSFINYCIRLGEKSDLYEILTGKAEEIKVPKIVEKEGGKEPKEVEKPKEETATQTQKSSNSGFSISSSFSDF